MYKSGLHNRIYKRFLQAFFVFGFCFAVIMSGANAQEQGEPVFDSLVWKARALVITGDYSDPLAEEQIAILRTDVPALAERDIAVLRFARDRIIEMSDLSNFQYRGWDDMDAHQQRYIEEKIQSDNNIFSVVLVGKDGLVKKVWGGPLPENLDGAAPEIAPPVTAVPLNEIFAIIDAMPMREREMQSPEQ